IYCQHFIFFFFSSRRRHTRSKRDWSSDVCSSDLTFFLSRAMPGDPIDVMAGRLTQGGMSMAEARAIAINSLAYDPDAPLLRQWRSEERRVGKECGSWWTTYPYRKKSRKCS